LDLSPVLRNAIGKLAASRFLTESCAFADYQLNTYFHILHSLSRRCELLPNGATIQSLFQAKVAPDVSLTFQTEQAWINGQPVLQFYFNNSIRNYLRSQKTTEISLTLEGKSGSHWIGLTQRKFESRMCIGYFPFHSEDLQDPSFSFLIPKDHPRDLVCVVTDNKNDESILAIKLDSLKFRLITNPTPFSLQPAITQPETEGLFVRRCSETEIDYEFEVTVRGVTINDVKG
jgi:hypothetical protein